MKRWLPLLLLTLLLSTPIWPQTALPTPVDPDVALTRQLRQAYRQVPGLSEVSLEVRGGVVVLRGNTTTTEASMEASNLAQKLEGVIAVDNGIEVSTDLQERLSPALAKLYQKGHTFLSFLPLFGIAIMIMMASVGLGKAVVRWDWLFNRFSRNVFVKDLLKHVVSFVFFAIGGLIALELLEATALVGAVLGTAGVLGVALGFAFQDLAENSLASVLLSLRQPFSPNDHVVIDGQEGKVVRLTSRATILLTLDGNHLRVPNAAVFKATILNYTRNPERRFTFSVGIDTEEEVPRAQKLAVETLLRAPGIMSDPPPNCLIETLGDSTVNLTVLGWVDQRVNDYIKVRSEAIRRIKESFDRANIIMPEPIYKVRLEQSEPFKKKDSVPLEPQEAVVDLAPDEHLEQRIVEERRTEEDDLLGPDGRQE